MSEAVLQNTPLVVDEVTVPVLQDSPYIYIQAPNGTEVKGKLFLTIPCNTLKPV